MLAYLHTSTAYSCFHATMAELSSCDRPYGPQNLKCLLSIPLQKKFVNCYYDNYTIIKMEQSNQLKLLLYPKLCLCIQAEYNFWFIH